MRRFVWFSDTHLNLSVFPFMKWWFVTRLKEATAEGLILTGDISSGIGLEWDLKFLAKHFDGPIYYVLGNHDYHKRHIDSVHADCRRLSDRFPNLHWMTETPIVSLNEDVALIGTEGWYDCQLGNPKWLWWTSDWLLTHDFRQLNGLEERIEFWRGMAKRSADIITERLEIALENHKTVYVMTHVPPWKEATRAVGTLFEDYWLPYNTNVVLGQAIERVMTGRKKKKVVVLAGHTHTPCHIRVSRSIECMVARASYWGSVKPELTIIV